MSHVFAARRGGHGLCAFCPELEDEGDHRELTPEEKDQAESLLASVIDQF